MAMESLEDRVTALEKEMTRLKARLEPTKETSSDWIDKIYGSFANDPIYEEAMRLGREYRESLRPKPKKRRKR